MTEKPSERPVFPMWLKIAILAGVVVLAGAAYLAERMGRAGSEQEKPEAAAVENRETIPDFILADADGNQKKLSEYKGSVVILSFWASWCAPCLVELPTFAEIEKRYGAKGLKIVPVNVEEGDVGKTFAKDFWNKNAFPFTNYFDPTLTMAQHFEIDILPSNFVLDRQERIVFSSFGANDWSSEETTEFLEGLLGEPAG